MSEINIFEINPIVTNLVDFVEESDKIRLAQVNSICYCIIKFHFNLDETLGKWRLFEYLCKKFNRPIPEGVVYFPFYRIIPQLRIKFELMYCFQLHSLYLLMTGPTGSFIFQKIDTDITFENSSEITASKCFEWHNFVLPSSFVFHNFKIGFSLVIDYSNIENVITKVVSTDPNILPHYDICEICLRLFPLFNIDIPESFINNHKLISMISRCCESKFLTNDLLVTYHNSYPDIENHNFFTMKNDGKEWKSEETVLPFEQHNHGMNWVFFDNIMIINDNINSQLIFDFVMQKQVKLMKPLKYSSDFFHEIHKTSLGYICFQKTDSENESEIITETKVTKISLAVRAISSCDKTQSFLMLAIDSQGNPLIKRIKYFELF